MNINKAFPSNYIKAADLDDKDVTLVIKSIKMEELGTGREKEEKPVIYFHRTEKGFVLNKTNAGTIEKLYGPETEQWIGKPITLCAKEVEFGGEMVWSIRVSLKKPDLATPKANEKTQPETDDVPF